MSALSYLTVCFILIISLRTKRVSSDSRIVSGEECSALDHPYMVAVFCTTQCGGTLLTLSWILTAAHCLGEDFDNTEFCLTRVGFQESSLAQVRWAKRGIRHPGFDRDIIRELRYDVGLILLEKPFKASPVSRPVKLPSKDYSMKCGRIEVLGSGRTKPLKGRRNDLEKPLMCVNLTISSRDVCARTWPPYHLDDSVLCTYEPGKDSCHGDSGGPLMCDDVQVGIVSAGKGCASTKPAANMAVVSYLEFISDTMEKYESNSVKFARRRSMGLLVLLVASCASI